MMDVVYPLANASKFHDDWELRYSLRSLMLQDWVSEIYLIGHCPEWVKDVVHVPCFDPYTSCKDANIINKILLVCNDPDLTDMFLVNSDDQYFLKAINEEELVPVLENPSRLQEYRFKSGIHNWDKRVISTITWCRKHGYPDHIFQSHIPYCVNKHSYPVAMSKVAWGQGSEFTTHVYLNIAMATQPQKEPVGRTIRVKAHTDAQYLRQAAKGATFLNHNDNGLTPILKNYLEEHFPNKSRWEK
jgi:hypothetical protein